MRGKPMIEHIARGVYYVEIHLLYASIVWSAAWVLTSIRGASATAKYWIWVAASLNFILPLGAVFDKLLASHLSWATPLGFIGDLAAGMSRPGSTATVLGAGWLFGASLMNARLLPGRTPTRSPTRAAPAQATTPSNT